MSPEDKFKFSKLRTSLIIMGIFWVVAIVLWQTTGKIFYILNFGYIGTAIGIGTGLYEALPNTNTANATGTPFVSHYR